MKLRILICTIFIFISLSLVAQEYIAFVEVMGYSEDMVGKRLIYQIKEEFRRSSAFILTDMNTNRIILIIHTIDPMRGSLSEYSNTMTTISATWLVADSNITHPFYISSNIGISGSANIKEMAEGIVATTDNLMTQIRKVLNQIYYYKFTEEMKEIINQIRKEFPELNKKMKEAKR